MGLRAGRNVKNGAKNDGSLDVFGKDLWSSLLEQVLENEVMDVILEVGSGCGLAGVRD